MKILVTGGGGFQGSHLTEFLVGQGHQVTILGTYSEASLVNLTGVLDKITVVWGSVTDTEIVDKTVRGQDVVFHLAAHINVDESLQDPSVFLRVNILGTFNVLEAAKKYGARLIHVSTCEVYGDGHDKQAGGLLNEATEFRPNSPYAASKAGADRLVYSYFKSFGLDATIIRPFNLYGERQKSGTFGALIPILTHRALRGEDLTVFGDGNASRDYTHVSDMIRGYNLVLKTPSLKGQAINFATGTNTKVKDIANYIAEKLKVKVVHAPARPGEVSRFEADISFARSLGFNPKVTIWQGINRYLNWAKKQKGV
ncbi:MAG: NAD-dependent epimerase/dehydratase family protein [Patescibacteria group bacterium]